MLLRDIISEAQVWARSGKKVVRKYRCTAGKRKGRVVAKPAQCFAAPDVKKRIKLKMTKVLIGTAGTVVASVLSIVIVILMNP